MSEYANREARLARFMAWLCGFVTAVNLALTVLLIMVGGDIYMWAVNALALCGCAYFDSRIIAEICLHGWGNGR